MPAIDHKAGYIKCFRLNDLEIGEIIGKGFYGNVYKIQHKHTGQVMVMKEMSKCTDDVKMAFRKEVNDSMSNPVNDTTILGSTAEKSEPPQYPPLYWNHLQRRETVNFNNRFISVVIPIHLIIVAEYVGGGTLRKCIKKVSNLVIVY